MCGMIVNLKQKFDQQFTVIKDSDGKVLTEKSAIKQRWKEYYENLHRDHTYLEKPAIRNAKNLPL